ncbi:hypothetical protein K2173_023207 [Erythroxylum novogranatense]|uniref:NAC domain-containing protein n=1 Tax=Erythroxylum novogranatense TaxID=1862640 RepID=A0AAV8T883_9ROSI|nr:hypothetical protein K2173_023207 [Erythroxylum novogranatense]
MDLVYNVGNRFCPTKSQLVNDYLVPKIASNDHLVTCIPEFDPFQLEPWNLPQDLKITPNDLELYVFCPGFPNLGRPKRTMITGYWRSTGYGSQITPENADGVTGTKKIFVFYKGKSPNESIPSGSCTSIVSP